MQFYGQAGEDKWMIDRYLEKMPQHKRVYLEAGALDGKHCSNTLTLEESFGWTGILVELNPVSFAALTKNRPRNELFNCVLSNTETPVEFQYFPNRNLAGVSGVAETLPKNVVEKFYTPSENEWLNNQQQTIEKIKLNPRRLADVLQDAGFDCIGFASLDVEGHEYYVLESHDWAFPIEYMLVEQSGDTRVDALLQENGYTFVELVAHNSLYHRPFD